MCVTGDCKHSPKTPIFFDISNIEYLPSRIQSLKYHRSTTLRCIDKINFKIWIHVSSILTGILHSSYISKVKVDMAIFTVTQYGIFLQIFYELIKYKCVKW